MSEMTFEKEKESLEKGFSMVVGVDEAGRGPLAGPVVACAAVLKKIDDFGLTIDESPLSLEDSTTPLGKGEQEKEWELVRDSKTLSEKQRERAFEFVKEKFSVGVGIVYPETIDRMNILEATFLAMKEAVSSLRKNLKNKDWIPGQARNDNLEKIVLLVDGNMTIPNLSLDQEAIVNGDSLVRSIAAASIIAKVTRDRMMLAYDEKYPQYGFAKHKGYGTKVHMDALRKYGPCPIHRMSFKPVRNATIEGINKKLSRK